MRRFVWILIVAFLAGVLVLGCGKPEEPKDKKPVAPAVAEKKEGDKKEPEKAVGEKKEGAEAAKPRDTQPGEAKPAAEKPPAEEKK